MNTTAGHNPFVFKQTETRPTGGRLILPKPREGEPPVQPPYVPYAAPGLKPYGRQARKYAPADGAMLVIAVCGLAATVCVGVPAGIVMGPMALKRANRVDELMRTGKRPPSDRGTVTGTRVCAWLAIVVSVPLVVIWAAVVALVIGALV